ncbi:MAG: cyanoexosortase B system-associated protein [Cyanophyceae cyanobacterium]
METPKSRPSSFPRLKGRSRLALALLLALLLGIAAVPGYLSGNWLWSDLPETDLTAVRALKQGLSLPGWETIDQATVRIGSHQWSAQLMSNAEQQATLFLLPQTYYRNQPEVEWMDVRGAERWKTDSSQTLQFSLPQTNTVTAHFFRAWNQRNTFAVVQWYAWPSGGHYAPARWFWLDQQAQLKRQRVPWVAVYLKIPITPLGELEAERTQAESLAKTVQLALLAGPLQPPAP